MITHFLGEDHSTLLAVEFNKVSSVGEHVPDEICELDI